jgi:hypothetical protein
MPVDSEGKEVAPSLHYSTRHVVIHRRTSPQRYTTLVLIHQSNKVDFSKKSMSSRNLSYKRKIMLTAFYLKELQMGLWGMIERVLTPNSTPAKIPVIIAPVTSQLQ